MKKVLKEFKEFAMKGNVVDLAVGVILGGAFGKIVSSLVADLIIPILGAISGKINFVNLQWSPVAGISVRYGNFLQTVLDFLIVASSVFFMIKVLNKLKIKQKEEEKKSDEVILLTEIRDILKDNKKDDE